MASTPSHARVLALVLTVTCIAAAPLPLAAKAEPADAGGEEGRKVVARHAEAMEREAAALREKDPRSAEVVAGVAKALREAMAANKGEAGAAAAGGAVPFDVDLDGPASRGPSRAVKATIVTAAEFRKNYAPLYPREANVARGGRATASSTHGEMDDPLTVLGGIRRRDTWSLNGPRGWFQAEWRQPVEGRYVFVFNRPRPGAGDAWESGGLEINGKPVARIGAFQGGQVVVADLGEVVSIKSLKLTIQGRDNPGIAGIEIYRAQRR